MKKKSLFRNLIAAIACLFLVFLVGCSSLGQVVSSDPTHAATEMAPSVVKKVPPIVQTEPPVVQTEPPVVKEFYLGAIEERKSTEDVRRYGNYPNLASVFSCMTLQSELAIHFLNLSEGEFDPFMNLGSKSHLINQFVSRSASYDRSLWDPELSEHISMEATPFNLLLIPMLSESEKSYMERNGSTIIQTPIAVDALVFYVSPSNPVDDLTATQLRDIYSGKIVNWKDVGGEDVDIVAFQQDGELEALDALVMNGTPVIQPPTEIQYLPDGVMDDGDSGYYEVEMPISYRDAPGSIEFGFLSELQGRDDLKLLKVDSAAPQMSEAYPLHIVYCAIYYEEDEMNVPGRFVQWLSSSKGKELIKRTELAPVE